MTLNCGVILLTVIKIFSNTILSAQFTTLTSLKEISSFITDLTGRYASVAYWGLS